MTTPRIRVYNDHAVQSKDGTTTYDYAAECDHCGPIFFMSFFDIYTWQEALNLANQHADSHAQEPTC